MESREPDRATRCHFSSSYCSSVSGSVLLLSVESSSRAPLLPLVGSLPFLSSQGSPGILDFALGDKYGDIYTVDVIWSKIVVLNDFAMAK
ncbi:Cytochrome P450 18A1, partial [Caligus rogercresseyi]